MRIISVGLHRGLDFVTVVAFALAPVVLALTGLAATLAYVLAVVHLALTLLTHFPEGARRPVPLLLHGAIEAVVGVALIVLPWVVGWQGAPRTFYVAAGVVILAVWVGTGYRTANPPAAA